MTGTPGPRQHERTPLEQMWRHTALFTSCLLLLALGLVALSGGR